MKNLSKKILAKTLLILVVAQIASCSGPVSSPRIWIFNSSDNYIRNIGGNWNAERLMGDMDLTPGGHYSQNFYLKRTITTELLGKTKSQLFGPINLEWENAEGKKIVKNFTITKEQLPYYYNYQGSASYHKFGRTTFDNVYFFLTQDDAEMFVEPDGVELKEVKNMWKQANKFSDDFNKLNKEQQKQINETKKLLEKAQKQKDEMLIKYGYHVPNCRSGTVASCKKIDRSKLTAEQKNTYDELSGFIDSAIGLKQRFIRENFKKNSVIKNNPM